MPTSFHFQLFIIMLLFNLHKHIRLHLMSLWNVFTVEPRADNNNETHQHALSVIICFIKFPHPVNKNSHYKLCLQGYRVKHIIPDYILIISKRNYKEKSYLLSVTICILIILTSILCSYNWWNNALVLLSSWHPTNP